MKRYYALIVFCAATILIPSPARANDDPKPAPALKDLPDGAVRNPNGTYSWTDKDGKKWIYEITPVGLSRSPFRAAASEGKTDVKTNGLKVTDKGDTVRFERKSLMGPIIWEKKKSDLNEKERRDWEEAQKPAAPQPDSHQ